MTSFAGAAILPEFHKTLLFKNRDLATPDHRDDVFYDVDCFGIRGKDLATGQIGGLAIGVNRYGLAVANTHVMNTEDPSYHILTEQILMFAKDAEDGLSMTADHLSSGRKYQWGNLILADHDSLLAIEIAGGEHSIEWSERKVLRTNHHIMLDTEEELRKYHSTVGSGDGYENSMRRVDRGYHLTKQIRTPEDIFSLLKDHDGEPGQASLCKHAVHPEDFSTVMSYVIEVDNAPDASRRRVVFHMAQGNPCDSQFRSIPLIFPADEEIMKRAISIYHAGT